MRKSIQEFAAGFDARLLSTSDAGEVVRVCSRIQASVESVKALAAARVAEGNSWQVEGYRSAADQLARVSGVSPSSATRTLQTGKRLASQPEVSKAALSGELSLEQAAAVSDGVAANPSAVGELLDAARDGSLVELNDKVAKIKAASCDPEARRKQIHAKRCLRRWTDRDGAFNAQMYGNPEDGASVWRMIDPIRRRLIVLRREKGAGSRESLDTLDYDALMTLAALAAGAEAEVDLRDLLDLGLFPQLDGGLLADRAPGARAPAALPPSDDDDAETPAPDLLSLLNPSAPTDDDTLDDGTRPPGTSPPDGDDPPLDRAGRPRRRRPKTAFSPARIMIRVDLDTLLRGYPIGDELCEMVGHGPVAVSVIEELISTGNAFLVGVLTKSHEIQGIYHHGRHPNAYQRSALDFLYPVCAVKGCHSTAGLQFDHREDWVRTHFTVYDLLDRLCPHHHRLKTHRNWALVEGSGKRDFVAPTDARHPDRARMARR